MREDVVVEVRDRVRELVRRVGVEVVSGDRIVVLRLRLGVGVLGICGLLGHVVGNAVVRRSAGALVADLGLGDGDVGASGSMVGGFVEL